MAHGANFEHRVNHKESAQNVDLSHSANFEQELDRTTTYKDIKDQADSQNQQIINQFSKHEKDNE
ncbi:hypothetical protein ACRCJU_09520 [Aerococcus urinaeequi]|uniref:hypothetical protein n=1 Tax=Aerococcus urinaeequi TaxID=51665 RepID=UPI003D6A7EBB